MACPNGLAHSRLAQLLCLYLLMTPRSVTIKASAPAPSFATPPQPFPAPLHTMSLDASVTPMLAPSDSNGMQSIKESFCDNLLAAFTYDKDLKQVLKLLHDSGCDKLSGSIRLAMVLEPLEQGSNISLSESEQGLLTSFLTLELPQLTQRSVALRSTMTGESMVEVFYDITPVDASDLMAWKIGIYDNFLTDDLSDELWLSGLPKSAIAIKDAIFHYGSTKDIQSVSGLHLLVLSATSAPGALLLLPRIDGQGFDNESIALLCSLANDLGYDTASFQWPCATQRSSAPQSSQSHGPERNLKNLFCNTLLGLGLNSTLFCSDTIGSIQFGVKLWGDNYPLTPDDRENLIDFIGSELPSALPVVEMHISKMQRDPLDQNSTEVVIQAQYVDAVEVLAWRQALKDNELTGNLAIDLIFTGINIDEITIGDVTYEYGTPLPNFISNPQGIAPRANETRQENAQQSLAARDTSSGNDRLQANGDLVILQERDTANFAAAGRQVTIDLDQIVSNAVKDPDMLARIRKLEDASSKAPLDPYKTAKDAAQKTVTNTLKFVSTLDVDDPRLVEKTVQVLVGGTLGVLAGVFGGPVAGAAVDVLATKIISAAFNYHPKYPVPAVALRPANATENAGILRINNQEETALLYNTLYGSIPKSGQKVPCSGYAVCYYANDYSTTLQSCMVETARQQCLRAPKNPRCNSLTQYITKLRDTKNKQGGDINKATGILNLYVQYQTYHLAALLENSINLNDNCPSSLSSTIELNKNLFAFQENRLVAVDYVNTNSEDILKTRANLIYNLTASDINFNSSKEAPEGQGLQPISYDVTQYENIRGRFRYNPTGCLSGNQRQYLQILANDAQKYQSGGFWDSAVPSYGKPGSTDWVSNKPPGYQCSYCDTRYSPRDTGVQTNGVLVRYGWVDRYENINRQYVDCQAPENAYNHEKKLVDIMRFHYSAAMARVTATVREALDGAKTWPADPGQLNEFFYYKYSKQYPNNTAPNYQGTVGGKGGSFSSSTGPRDDSAITILTVWYKRERFGGDQSQQSSSHVCGLAVSYNSSNPLVYGQQQGETVTISLQQADFINSTTVWYHNYINAMRFQKASGGPAIDIGNPMSTYNTTFIGNLKGFQIRSANIVDALGVYTVTNYTSFG